MKLLLRMVALVLTVATLATFMVACGQGGSSQETKVPDETEKAVETTAMSLTDLSKYKIVRSDYLAATNQIVSETITLRKAIKAATGVNLTMDTDWVQKGQDTSQSYEILVGTTNRDASAEVLATLTDSQFYIGQKGPKILVFGKDEFATLNALDYLIKNILQYDKSTDTAPAADAFFFPTDYVGEYVAPTTVYILEKDLAAKSSYDANELVRFYTSLQGILNRSENIEKNDFYIYQNYDEQDTFWLNYLREDGHMFDYIRTVSISSFETFWNTFGDYIKELGMVTWDKEVAASANVAATICGVDGYLPVMWDASSTSLYSFLKSKGVQEKMTLVGLFNDPVVGEKIGDSNAVSIGSSKCDAYLWALDKYMDKCSTEILAYVLDAAGCIPGNEIYEKAQGKTPNWNQIYNHDYLIQNKCFFFDLTLVDDELPCDDPYQPMGADRKALDAILQKAYDRSNGNMITVMGFPMWWMKYTSFLGHGKTEPTTLEWKFVEHIGTYNCLKEADAAHPAWMTNGSVYTHFQLDPSKFMNQNESQYPDMVFDNGVRYFTIYLGDYDSGAWMKQHIPTFWADKARGTLPLMWSFNPNLSRRVPMVFQYVFENQKDLEVITAGDSGAGYVIPSALVDKALRGDRPSGANAWVNFCKEYMSLFNMDMVGFIINGDNKMNTSVYKMYNEFAPAGSFHNDPSKRLVVYNGVVYMHLMNGIDPDGGNSTYKTMLDYMNSASNINFAGFRTVCNSPSSIKTCVEGFIEYAEAYSKYKYVYVDPYTLFELAAASGQGVTINQ